MLQLILGLGDKARTEPLYQEIEKKCGEHTPVWILVPEQFSL